MTDLHLLTLELHSVAHDNQPRYVGPAPAMVSNGQGPPGHWLADAG